MSFVTHACFICVGNFLEVRRSDGEWQECTVFAVGETIAGEKQQGTFVVEFKLSEQSHKFDANKEVEPGEVTEGCRACKLHRNGAHTCGLTEKQREDLQLGNF
eukprot:gene15528-31162_t